MGIRLNHDHSMKASEWLHERGEDFRDFAILAIAAFFFVLRRTAVFLAIILVVLLFLLFTPF